MSKAGIGWLYSQLPELINKGVLTQESADKLRQHYGEIKSINKLSMMFIALGTIGAILVGLGIILLLAHNWDQFSRLTRAVISFLPLIAGQGLALWVLCKRPQSGSFKEGSAAFLSLMVGASVALICQTYNIPEDAGVFTITWMFLILPLVYLMQASIPAAIYLVGITIWSGMQISNPAKVMLFWPLSAVIIPHFIWALRKETYALRSAMLSLVMLICVSIAASFSLGRNWPGLWVVIFPSLYAIFYLIGISKFNNVTTNWQRPLHLIGAIGLFILAFQFSFRQAWQYLDRASYYNAAASDFVVFLDNLVTMAIVITAILLFYGNVKRNNKNFSLLGLLPLLAIIGLSVYRQSIVLPFLIFNAYLLILSIRRILAGIRSNNLAVINTGMLVLAVVIIARFFDSDISFVTKGLVFIAIGIGFLTANAMLARRMRGAK